jgi:hypothetical protein
MTRVGKENTKMKRSPVWKPLFICKLSEWLGIRLAVFPDERGAWQCGRPYDEAPLCEVMSLCGFGSPGRNDGKVRFQELFSRTCRCDFSFFSSAGAVARRFSSYLTRKRVRRPSEHSVRRPTGLAKIWSRPGGLS